MQRQEPRKVIGGRQFVFGTLPAEDAFDVFASVVKNLGEPLVQVLAGGVKGDTMAIGISIVGMVAKNLNAAEIKEAIKKLLTVTATSDGGRCDMDATFTGNILQMLQVAVESFKVNFADFLAVVPSTSPQAGTATASSPSSPPT